MTNRSFVQKTGRVKGTDTVKDARHIDQFMDEVEDQFNDIKGRLESQTIQCAPGDFSGSPLQCTITWPVAFSGDYNVVAKTSAVDGARSWTFSAKTPVGVIANSNSGTPFVDFVEFTGIGVA